MSGRDGVNWEDELAYIKKLDSAGDQRAGQQPSVSVQGRLRCPRCKEGTTFLISLKDAPGLWITCGACGWTTNSALISLAVPPVSALRELTNNQIKYMVSRFLAWRLPENFNPDAGISFKPYFNEHTKHPMKSEPVGTNLFSATQAEEMVRYLVEGMPGTLDA